MPGGGYLIDCRAACQAMPCTTLLLITVHGFAGAALGGLTLPFAFRFRFTTETLRVSFRLTAGPGSFGATSTFPRGNVPLPVYERCRNEDGSSTRSCTIAIVSVQPAVSPVMDDSVVRSHAIVRLKPINYESLLSIVTKACSLLVSRPYASDRSTSSRTAQMNRKHRLLRWTRNLNISVAPVRV